MNIRRALGFYRSSRRLAQGIVVCGLFFFCAAGLAETYTLTVKVTVVERVCDINNNQPISVSFGSLVIKNIDGVAYETDIPYTLQCQDAGDNPGLKLKFSGAGSSFNSNLLATSESNLGLRFKQEGNAWNLNTWTLFNYSSAPRLTVVPVKNGSGGVGAGDFTASGTLSVEYQ